MDLPTASGETPQGTCAFALKSLTVRQLTGQPCMPVSALMCDLWWLMCGNFRGIHWFYWSPTLPRLPCFPVHISIPLSPPFLWQATVLSDQDLPPSPDNVCEPINLMIWFGTATRNLWWFHLLEDILTVIQLRVCLQLVFPFSYDV